MSDNKFENLPGIAYDQPDCYETPDVPEVDTSDYYEEEAENDSIERLHISTKDSYNKFKGKNLEGYVDFSGSIARRKYMKGYDALSNEYEIIGEGEKETPVQKCRRLQCEMNELMDEISLLQMDKQIENEEKQSYDAVVTVIVTAKKVLDSLRLEQVFGKEQISSASEKEIKSLINQVEEYKKSGVLTAIQPPLNDLASSTRIAKLEHRLFLLEQAVGAQPDKLSRLAGITGTSNLIEAVRQLSTKAALLVPNQLDLIENRLESIVGKMDAIAQRSSGSTEDEKRNQKICDLYDIAKRTETIAEILPEIIERMEALESLHKYANNFAKLIAEIEETQKTIAHNLVDNKSLLHSVQETFAQNIETLNAQVSKLEGRLNVISSAQK